MGSKDKKGKKKRRKTNQKARTFMLMLPLLSPTSLHFLPYLLFYQCNENINCDLIN